MTTQNSNQTGTPPKEMVFPSMSPSSFVVHSYALHHLYTKDIPHWYNVGKTHFLSSQYQPQVQQFESHLYNQGVFWANRSGMRQAYQAFRSGLPKSTPVRRIAFHSLVICAAVQYIREIWQPKNMGPIVHDPVVAARTNSLHPSYNQNSSANDAAVDENSGYNSPTP